MLLLKTASPIHQSQQLYWELLHCRRVRLFLPISFVLKCLCLLPGSDICYRVNKKVADRTVKVNLYTKEQIYERFDHG